MRVGARHFRTIWLADDGDAVEVIDQTALPGQFVTKRLESAEEVAVAIRTMVVRGAPLIGVAAAYGVALGMRKDASDAHLADVSARLRETRPTAVNLAWAVEQMRRELAPARVAERPALAFRLAARLADEDVAMCRAIGEHGAVELRRVLERRGGSGPLRVLTHCNAGWLATVDFGTALSPLYHLFDQGVPLHVWVDETRPRDQGYLTAWELTQHGVPCSVIADNAGGHYMQHGQVDAVIVGSDRTTRNGDVCNKIGTYLKALAARDNGVPFYVALPSSTIDPELASGRDIPIEERDGAELTSRFPANNPAFDVTPARLVTAIITERGVFEPSEPGMAGALR